MTSNRQTSSRYGGVSGDPGQVDRTLATRSAAGDKAAFEEIYRRHVNRVYGLCLRLTADRVEAESLTQDTFVKAWLSMGGFSGRGDLGGWLRSIAINHWRDLFRSRARKDRLLEQLAAEHRPSAGKTGVGNIALESADPAAGGVPLLTGMDLERCLVRLSEGARSVFVLHEIEGYPHREIADLLGIATGTVKAHLHRAKRLLRAMLAEERETAHG